MSFIIHMVKACIINVRKLIRVWCVASGCAETPVAELEEGCTQALNSVAGEPCDTRAGGHLNSFCNSVLTTLEQQGHVHVAKYESRKKLVEQDRGPAMLKCPRARQALGKLIPTWMFFQHSRVYLGSF